MSTSLTDEATEDPGIECECKPDHRVACHGEASHRTPEGRYYCVIHLPGKDKRDQFRQVIQKRIAAKRLNFQGAWFPDEFSPGGISNDLIWSVDANFTEAIFNGPVDFSNIQFDADARFVQTTFSGPANFGKTIFSGAFFSQAIFNAEASFAGAAFRASAIFSDATLSGDANFRGTNFSGSADFTEATFKANATFRSAKFTGHADFGDATFAGYADFRLAEFNVENKATAGGKGSLDLQFAKIDKADHLSFDVSALHPHWFRNVDARKIDFTRINWRNHGKVKEETKLLQKGGRGNIPGVLPMVLNAWKQRGVLGSDRRPKKFTELIKAGWRDREQQKDSLQDSKEEELTALQLLDITCRKLAANAEENNRYSEASHFRRMALDAERLGKWRGFAFWKLNSWYWASSGYGERPLHAFAVLIGMCVAFALIYMGIASSGWEQKAPSLPVTTTVTQVQKGDLASFGSAFTYSLGVMTLQKPDPRPVMTWPKLLVLSETILGPLQAAMLALAIRRRFMR